MQGILPEQEEEKGEATTGLLFRRLWAARSPAEELEPLEFEAGKEEGSEFQVSALA